MANKQSASLPHYFVVFGCALCSGVWSELLTLDQGSIRQGGTAIRLCLPPCLEKSYRQLEMDPGGRIYTREIGRWYKPGILVFFVLYCLNLRGTG